MTGVHGGGDGAGRMTIVDGQQRFYARLFHVVSRALSASYNSSLGSRSVTKIKYHKRLFNSGIIIPLSLVFRITAIVRVIL